MSGIKQLALWVCVLSAAAGLLRAFWPENGWKPVINLVLTLYILTTGVRLLQQGPSVLRGIDFTPPRPLHQTDFEAYRVQLGAQAGAQALEQLLQNAGIQAAVELREGVCHIVLAHPADRPRALTLLEQNAGSLPYTLQEVTP